MAVRTLRDALCRLLRFLSKSASGDSDFVGPNFHSHWRNRPHVLRGPRIHDPWRLGCWSKRWGRIRGPTRVAAQDSIRSNRGRAAPTLGLRKCSQGPHALQIAPWRCRRPCFALQCAMRRTWRSSSLDTDQRRRRRPFEGVGGLAASPRAPPMLRSRLPHCMPLLPLGRLDALRSTQHGPPRNDELALVPLRWRSEDHRRRDPPDRRMASARARRSGQSCAHLDAQNTTFEV